jgi:UDPglucose 6-dehydrogenase
MRSTVLPETCRKIVIPSIEEHSGKHVGEDFGFVMNPEFLREGNALNDLRKPIRIVIGGYDDKSSDMLLSFYRDIYGETHNYIKTSIENAEIIKYANNAFLATKVSFINSIARICENVPNTDVQVVREVIGSDPRIGPLFLNAGIGFGGSCLPKDLRALVYFAKERGYKPVLLEGAYEVNVGQPRWVVMKLKEIYNKLVDRKVAVLGLSFKPGTSDTRESQAVKVIEALVDEGCKVSAYDPMANEEFIGKYYHLGVEVSSTIEGCVSGSDAVVIATEWDEFKKITPEYYLEKMKNPVVIDGRRIYDPKVFLSKGVTYIGVGYPIW